MAQPFIGEIRMFAGNFAPAGWMFCEGQLLAISEYDAFFNLIGTTYGGDGQDNFALPDLRGRLPMHQSSGHPLAESAGVEQVMLTQQQIPSHSHSVVVSLNNATSNAVSGNLTGTVGAAQIYREAAPNATMNAASIVATGGSQPHTNFQPYLCVNFIISLFGIFPSQT